VALIVFVVNKNFKKLRALSHFLSERCDTFKSVKKPVELMTLLRVSLRTILQYIKKVGAGKVFCVMGVRVGVAPC